MSVWILDRTTQFIHQYMATTGRPRHIAHGVALGMLLGLIPKTNLTAVALLASLFVLPIHLGSALLSACVFSLLSPWLDPLTDRLGAGVLQTSLLRGLWGRWMEQPLTAWTALDNTVVLGALILGVMLYAPVSRMSRRLAAACSNSAPGRTARWAPEASRALTVARPERWQARAVRRLNDDNIGDLPLVIEEDQRIITIMHRYDAPRLSYAAAEDKLPLHLAAHVDPLPPADWRQLDGLAPGPADGALENAQDGASDPAVWSSFNSA